MNQVLKFADRWLSPLLNTRAAGMYILLFAIAIGAATFVENDFGTSAAQKIIFQAWWFEVLLVLFGLSIIRNIFKFRMIKQKKWTLLTFHSAIIIILIGAAITRSFGFEGMMHIRENGTSNTFLSSNTFLNFQVEKNGQTYAFDEPVLFASLGNNNWEESYLVDGDLIEVKVKEFIPNPVQVMHESMEGQPTLKIVIAGMNGREEYFIQQGNTKRVRDLLFNFTGTQIPGAFNIFYENESLSFTYPTTLTQMVMATQKRDTIPSSDIPTPLALRALYSDGQHNIVFPEFNPRASVSVESEGPKVKNESVTALMTEVSINGEKSEGLVYGSKGVPGRPALFEEGGTAVSVAYGSKDIFLPFSLQLNDFILEKYPGTNSASSYASEVTLIDDREGIREDSRIYMNNILNYGGYRFFQSSFDRDELGTYLSVNSDYWGSLISYIGYALLTIGMFLTFFSRKTRFFQVSQKIKKLRAGSTALVIGLLLSPIFLPAQTTEVPAAHLQHAVSVDHADLFSRMAVQDFKGRMKPVHTLSREVLRKIYRRESFEGLNADQVLLSIFVNSREWYDVPLIKLGKHEDIQLLLETNGDFASYNDFFLEDGTYKLRDEVRRVYGMDPKDRGTYEKELIKIDERLNILNMAFSGSLLKMVPIPGSDNNTWLSYHSQETEAGETREVADNFFNSYGGAVGKGVTTGDYSDANRLLNELRNFQQNNGGDVMPSKAKVNAEIFLNQLNVFSRLSLFYLILSLAFLFFLFYSVFKPDVHLKKVYWVLFSLVGLGFILHTLGLGLRWYVSGRAPWSNGYESLIYIAWTTTLAGVIFTRKSLGGLAATTALAATILFVAMLSAFDPEITPLVPVLKSYWLTIHVSLEAGSYGFLMLGAIIGLINLILISFTTEGNKDRIRRIVTEMSLISEMTLMGGLFMVSVGTYLGGVWANESWGRYWGWDAKETWALVTILVYAFILHMRIIPKMTGLFLYNVSTIIGMASVIMTYFGVNYYLSGLHSYASGDPVPIPSWVYGAIAAVVALSLFAYYKKRKYKAIT